MEDQHSQLGSNQLAAGSYTVQSVVVPVDNSTGGQASVVEPITVVVPAVVAVPNSTNSDINAKVVGLADGGYVLIWAQNQVASVGSGGSNYDIVLQRYDQSGNKVGAFVDLTNTPTGGNSVSEGYADRSDMWGSSGSLSAVLNPDNTLTVAYNANQGTKTYVTNYGLDGTLNAKTQVTPAVGGWFFGYNLIETSNGKVAVYSNGSVWSYKLYAAGENQAVPFATTQQIDNTAGVNSSGYINAQSASYAPTGYRGYTYSTNIESLSAVSIGGSKYIVQYAEFSVLGSGGPTKQTIAVYDYIADGTGKFSSVLQTKIQANSFDNGWQIGAKSLVLKEGGFVSLWGSNHSTASSPTNGGTMAGFGVYSKRFNYDAVTNVLNPLDANEKLVNTTTNGVNGIGFNSMSTGNFSATALAQGGYVVVWVKMLTAGSSEVYSQAFDAAGNKIGGETLVSTQTVDGPGTVDMIPSVTGLKDGGYVVTWSNVTTTDYAINNASADVKMVIVNADGTLRSEGEILPITADYLNGTGTLTATNAVTTLDGRNGATDLIGGTGNDYFIVKDTNFNSVIGGGGTDTLIWDSTANLTLADILSKVSDIEVVHLGDANANTLYVTLNDILSMSPTNDTLIVQGGNTDIVSIDQTQWSTLGTQIYHGLTYNVYTNSTNSSASLWIESNLTVIG